MSNTPSTTETIAALGADLSQGMHQAMAQTKPVLTEMAERVNERLHRSPSPQSHHHRRALHPTSAF